MRPTWLIEAGIYGDEIFPLLNEIRRQGLPAEVVSHRSLKKGSSPTVYGQQIPSEGCVLGYGTFPFARQILIHHRWVPGAWCSAENLDCSTYFAHFGRYLLNQQYILMPGVEAIRQRDWLFSVLGSGAKVFARPTSCRKLFVGRCIDMESFASGLAPARYDPSALVVIATPKVIAREWRLVVIGDRVVSGSQYAVGGERAISADSRLAIRR